MKTGIITAIKLQWRQSIPHFNRNSVQQIVMLCSRNAGSIRFHKYVIRCLGVFAASCFGPVQAQLNTDNAYALPLGEVLADVGKKYGVMIKYTDSMVANKTVNYARWRYRNDVEATLDNVLKPLDLKVKKEKDKVYKLSSYEYYRWPVEEGWAELDRIASQYNNLNEWEVRKHLLKPCLMEALRLDKLPLAPNTKPVITTKRKYNGYTVENIAIEILPGLYINGSLYKPAKYKGKIPVVLNPDGHWEKHRYRSDCQYRCAAIAKMGAMAFSYDLFAWGESLLQFKLEDHRRSLAMTIQVLGSIRILDYLLAQRDADTNRVAIVGGSGGGTHAMLMTAIENRIKLSVPALSVSSYFYGGCPCESGMPIHDCGNRTDNVELAAMAAPRPQLVISDGGDWTDKMPQHDLIYLQKMYGYYNKPNNVENVHLPMEQHDFGINKRIAVYQFIAKHFNINLKAIQDQQGNIDESGITIEKEEMMYVFGDKGEKLPAHAIHGFEQLEKVFPKSKN
ncbi:MAG: acetylxylan esterase [Ferruginibacter sp.]